MVETQKEGKFMELTIEIKNQTGKVSGALSDVIRTPSNDSPGERMQGVPGLPGRGGWRGFLSFGSMGSAGELKHYLRSTNGLALLGAIDFLSERAAVKTGQDAPWEGIDVLRG